MSVGGVRRGGAVRGVYLLSARCQTEGWVCVCGGVGGGSSGGGDAAFV